MRALAIILLLHAGLTAAAESPKWDACVLNFQKQSATTSYQIQRAFSDSDKKVKIVEEALPKDILECVSEGVTSITIIAHAADFSSNAQMQAPLVYFSKLEGAEREKFLTDLKNTLLEKQSQDPDDSETVRMLDELESMPKDAVVYDEPKLIMGNIWKHVLQNPGQLKQLSIIACMPSKVEAAYPEFQEFTSHGITVKFAPTNRFMSFFFHKDVTTLDTDWLKNSILE